MTLPEAGKVAHGVVEGLRTNPSCLAAIVLAAFFGLLMYISLQRDEERSQARLEATLSVLNKCLDEPKQ